MQELNLMFLLVMKKQTLIRETFAEKFNVRELQLIPLKEEEEAFEGTEVQFESVDPNSNPTTRNYRQSQVVDKEKINRTL